MQIHKFNTSDKKARKNWHVKMRRSEQFEKLALIRAVKACMGPRRFVRSSVAEQLAYMEKYPDKIAEKKQEIYNDLRKHKRIRDKRRDKKCQNVTP